MTLKEVVQLHEEVTIVYTVYDPKYTAILYEQDGSRPILEAGGESPAEALENLDKLVQQQPPEMFRIGRKNAK